MDLQYIYKCNLCGKKYKHRQSLNNHNRKIHDIKVTKSQPLGNQMSTEISLPEVQKIFECSYCNKIFVHKQSKYRHEKKCKKKNNDRETIEILKQELKDIKEQMFDILNKNYKMHPKTLQKINNQLNNCNIINIVQFGKEDVINNLTKQEQIMILDKKHQSLNHLIEFLHFNKKFPQFQNIAITNLKDNIAYMYNEEKNQFIAMNKNELLENVIDLRMLDIEELLANNEDCLDEKTKDNIKKFINKMTNDEKYFELKKSDIKLLLYNNKNNEMINNYLN
jgi:uncharacterized C2H2 Zn-finger protein